MASDKKEPTVTTVEVRPRTSSSGSIRPSLSLKSPRAARFAEATSVNSPIEPSKTNRAPFAETQPSNYFMPQPQPADVGFGYINGNDHRSAYGGPGVEMPASPKSPLKSALKSPGAPARKIEHPLSPSFKENILSPTFKEEKHLEKTEKSTDKEQAHDLKVKIRVRMAKMVLRGTNFACSLIVLAMLASTFNIINQTIHLPTRNQLPAWAPNTPLWPQITVLVISCVSLFMSMVVMWAYLRGGHNRAQKTAVYYTTFSIAFFMFSIIMWALGAGILQQSRTNNNGDDIWGWSCKSNTRSLLFQEEVQYSIICRMQNWSLVCCLIEVVVELITILIYGIVFYRVWSKRKLRKSMAGRDRARSDLYLAQLRTQSAPNTPGLPMSPGGPFSPRDGGYNPMFSPRFAPGAEKDEYSAAEKGEGVQYISPQPKPEKPFRLMAAPTKGTPKSQRSFSRPTTPQVMVHESSVPPPIPQSSYLPNDIVHMPAAPGERQYGAVPIPGAYASPVQSPTFAPAGNQFGSMR